MALPEVGEHGVAVLSPTVLELSLVTTKDATGPVTTWNFVGANFAPQLPAPNDFAVEINGTRVAVEAVGFKRRPLYAPLRTRDLRIGNALYLRLAQPVPEGTTVSVTNPSGSIWSPGSLNFSTVAEARRFNPAIHVNQAGYLPNATKLAMVGYYLGSLGELNVESPSFELLDATTGALRFTGALTPRLDVGFSYTPTPYQHILQADFTSFRTPGEYVLRVAGMGVSHRFFIHEGTAGVFARTLALGLYHQRCGARNELPWTRHEHDFCHIGPVEVPTIENTTVTWVLGSETWNYQDEPRHTAPQLKDVDSSLYPFINRGPLNLRGGHHDAGDYSKYTINSAGLIHHLVFAADAFPGVAALDNLGVPESGDGRSDILQEAKWEADFLANMQDADGGFYFLVYPRNRRYEDDVLPDHGDPQLVFPKTTAATAAAVGALAEIASSPTFKAQFPTEAALYLQKARRGWDFLTTAIARFGKDGAYQKITHYGNEFMHDDELAWAAAALYAATGEPVFHNAVRAWYDPSDRNTRRWTWWRLFEGYGCAARDYAFAARSGRLPIGALDPVYLAKCEAEIVAAGNDIARFAQESAYGTSFPDPNKAFRSAGWYFSSERSFELSTAQQIAPNSAYQEALISNWNYEAGCNPLNLPYITGIGWQRWRDIVHQYAQNDYQVLPPSGLPLGNIQGGFAYLENYKQELGQLCFPPDGAATAPYPFYDRWGDSFNTTTEFVIMDQARALGAAASLFATTAPASIAYVRPALRITGVPTEIPALEEVVVSIDAGGTDLSQARAIWEARDQQPVCANVFRFSPKNPGDQWLEVEVLFPDGTRAFAKTNFYASYPVRTPPNAYRSAPQTPSADMAALFHFDGNFADATGLNPALAAAGNTRLDAMNLGWMANRAGNAIHFFDLGDKATLTIPGDRVYRPGATARISIEAMIYVNAYKAWNRTSSRLLALERTWNASVGLIEDIYTGAHARGGVQFDIYGAALNNALTTKEWHHLAISIDTTGYTLRVDGTLVASAASSELSGWSGGDILLEIGNFDGWLDELVVKNSTAVALQAPSAPLNFAPVSVSSSAVSLSWSIPASGNVERYSLYRSVDNVNFLECATAPADVLGWTDTGLLPDTTYFYAIKASNSGGTSAETLTSARTSPNPPPTPARVMASGRTNGIAISWMAAAGAESYRVYRSADPSGPFAVIGNTSAVWFDDSSAAAGVLWNYVVTGVNPGGESVPSRSVSASVLNPVPRSPRRVFVSLSLDHLQIAWMRNSTDETYNIQRSTSASGPFQTVATNLALPSFADYDVQRGVTYYYIVSASNSFGKGSGSQIVNGKLLEPRIR